MALPSRHYVALDGWRGVSILLVLASHLLPLGPKAWQLNFTVGVLGMALFFCLSGFLITSFLIKNTSTIDFLIKRFFRVIPLVWLYLVAVTIFFHPPLKTLFANLFFYANWPPMQFVEAGGHLWSLCVEIQFYVSIAVIFSIFGRKGLYLLPAFCVAITLFRFEHGVHAAINTYYRLDEILVGCILALVYFDKLGAWTSNAVRKSNPLILAVLLIISCHPESGFMNYFRPYLAAMLVGFTLLSDDKRLSRALDNRVLVYIASISYALYIIHPMLADSWLGSGDKILRYVKRPLLFLVLFGLAHASTFYYEHKFIAVGRRLSNSFKERNVAP